MTQCEEEENNAPALDDEVAFNNNAIRFKVVFSGPREVVKIMCEEGKNFLLHNRVITPGSFSKTNHRDLYPLCLGSFYAVNHKKLIYSGLK